MFHRVEFTSCVGEREWVYVLEKSVDSSLLDALTCLADVQFPMGRSYSYYKIETPNFLLVGNVGSNELKFRLKPGADPSAKERFEKVLTNLLHSSVKGDEDDP